MDPEQRQEMEDKLQMPKGERQRIDERLLRLEAIRRVSREKRFRLMPSARGLVLISLTGALAIAGLVAKGFHDHEWDAERAAYFHWTAAAILAVLFLLFLVNSIALRRKFKKAVAIVMESGMIRHEERFAFLSDPKIEKAKDVKLNYPIESFETLSEVEFDLAEEEWDSLDATVTERFYRMPAFLQPFKGDVFYTAFIEMRYEDVYPEFELLRMTCKEVETAVTKLRFHGETELQAYKDQVKEIVREKMAKSFPNLYLQEICVAVKRIA